MLVGLVSFIRASVKDRTETAQFVTNQSEESLLDQLRQYFTQRAYQVAAVDADHHQVTLSGFVRPSVFLAVFLSILAAVGLLCLSLVLGILLPPQATLWFGLPVLSPLAGAFYWKQAGRPEQVSFKVEPFSTAELAGELGAQNVLTVVAHRDELLSLERSLSLKKWEAE